MRGSSGSIVGLLLSKALQRTEQSEDDQRGSGKACGKPAPVGAAWLFDQPLRCFGGGCPEWRLSAGGRDGGVCPQQTVPAFKGLQPCAAVCTLRQMRLQPLLFLRRVFAVEMSAQKWKIIVTVHGPDLLSAD